MTNDTDDEILSKLNPGIAGTSFFTNCGRPAIKEVPEKNGRKLTRVPFKVSRLMEFCTRRELVNQTGHDVYEWALVVQKELLDNALDAAEEAEIAPVVSIAVNGRSIVIQDNGPGIPAKTIEGILDYSVRVSSREAYVSPTRGAQGNALKTILPMAYVLDERHGDNAAGETIIEAQASPITSASRSTTSGRNPDRACDERRRPSFTGRESRLNCRCCGMAVRRI